MNGFVPMSLHAVRQTRWLAVVALAAVLASAGCVTRRMTIVSDPPGALVYVDNHEIGTTPVSTDFIYYGRRQIRLVKDGYETVTYDQWLLPPWYQVFPLDFVSENVVPWEMRDERVLRFPMQPQMVVPTDQLLGRANGLRQSTQQQAAASSPPAALTLPVAEPNQPANVAPAAGSPPAALFGPPEQYQSAPAAIAPGTTLPPANAPSPYGGTAIPAWP